MTTPNHQVFIGVDPLFGHAVILVAAQHLKLKLAFVHSCLASGETNVTTGLIGAAPPGLHFDVVALDRAVIGNARTPALEAVSDRAAGAFAAGFRQCLVHEASAPSI